MTDSAPAGGAASAAGNERGGKVSCPAPLAGADENRREPPPPLPSLERVSAAIDENLRLFRLTMVVLMGGSAAVAVYSLHARLLRRHRSLRDVLRATGGGAAAFEGRPKLTARVLAVSREEGGLLAVDHLPPLLRFVPRGLLAAPSPPFLPLRLHGVRVEEPGFAWLQDYVLERKVQVELLYPSADSAVVLMRRRKGVMGLWKWEDVGLALVEAGHATYVPDFHALQKERQKRVPFVDLSEEGALLAEAEGRAKSLCRGVWRDLARNQRGALSRTWLGRMWIRFIGDG